MVNASDLAKTKGQAVQSLSNENFREDVNASGSINGSDVSLVKSKSGTALPTGSGATVLPERGRVSQPGR